MSAVERAVDGLSEVVYYDVAFDKTLTIMPVGEHRALVPPHWADHVRGRSSRYVESVIDSLRADLASADPERVRETAEALGLTDLLRVADECAVAVVLLAEDAHPAYGNTAGWRGGIGGQAVSLGCSIIDPPPGAEWTQYALPTGPAREWFARRVWVDHIAIGDTLKQRWLDEIGPRVVR